MSFNYSKKPPLSKNIVYGIRAVEEALDTNTTIEKVFVLQQSNSPILKDLISLLEQNGSTISFVPEAKLNRITRKNHQGIIAFTSPVPFHDIEEIIMQVYEKGEDPLIIALDGVTDVRNLGAIIRSAAAANAHAILLPTKNSAPINEEAAKTSAGGIFQIPICKTQNLHIKLKKLKENGLLLVGASEKAEDNPDKVDLKSPTVIIMGAEDKGISAENLKICHRIVKLPFTGKPDSLNVSVAAGIFIYEVLRQRS